MNKPIGICNNKRHFWYFKNDPAKLNIDILTAGCAQISDWNPKNNCPFWRYWCNDSSGMKVSYNNKEYQLIPNQAYIIPPNTQIEPTIDSTVSKHLFIHFLLENSSVIAEQGVYSSKAHTRIQPLIKKLTASDRTNFTITYSTIFEITSTISDGLSDIPDGCWGGLSNDSVLSKVLHYMNMNYQKEIKNDTLAKITGLTRNAFIRKFTSRMKVSPIKHLEQIRLAKAKIALQYSSKSINKIAEECGFNDRFYFTTRFKKSLNTTPAKYRIKNN